MFVGTVFFINTSINKRKLSSQFLIRSHFFQMPRTKKLNKVSIIKFEVTTTKYLGSLNTLYTQGKD